MLVSFNKPYITVGFREVFLLPGTRPTLISKLYEGLSKAKQKTATARAVGPTDPGQGTLDSLWPLGQALSGDTHNSNSDNNNNKHSHNGLQMVSEFINCSVCHVLA